MLKLTATGRLGKDAEQKYTPNGKAVLSFSVGTDVGWGDKKHTVWLECAIWGDRGEKVAPYLLKGTPVTVNGDGDLRTWEKDGKHGAVITCNVTDVEMHGKKAEQTAPKSEGFRKTAAAADDFDDDQIPF